MDNLVKEIINAALSGGEMSNAGQKSAVPRPNYQREQSQKRLMTFDLTPKQSIAPAEFPQLTKSIQTDSTALRMVQLSSNRLAGNAQAAQPASSKNQCEQSCGRNRSTVYEVIENADLRTIRLAGLNCSQGSTVGLAYSECATLSQLFAADKAVSQFPALAIMLHWNEENDQAFFFRCAGKKDEVEQAIALMKQQENSTPAICGTNTPNTVIGRRLKITSGFVAGIDGVPLACFLPLVNDYYKEHPESTLEFISGKRYLLVRGEEQQAVDVLQQFLQQSSR